MKDCKYYIRIIDGDSKSYHYFNGKKESDEFYEWARRTINPRCEITRHEAGNILNDNFSNRTIEENVALALAEFYDRGGQPSI